MVLSDVLIWKLGYVQQTWPGLGSHSRVAPLWGSLDSLQVCGFQLPAFLEVYFTISTLSDNISCTSGARLSTNTPAI
jgi:hypothetical protein